MILHDHFAGKKRAAAGQVHAEEMINSPQKTAEDGDGGTNPNPLNDDIEIEELIWFKSSLNNIAQGLSDMEFFWTLLQARN